MTTWLRSNGLEVRILTIDERPIEPEVEVEVVGTGETKWVQIGKLVSSSGDAEVWGSASEVMRDEE